MSNQTATEDRLNDDIIAFLDAWEKRSAPDMLTMRAWIAEQPHAQIVLLIGFQANSHLRILELYEMKLLDTWDLLIKAQVAGYVQHHFENFNVNVFSLTDRGRAFFKILIDRWLEVVALARALSILRLSQEQEYDDD